MAGTPTEVEIQAIWRNAVDVLETLRAQIDATQAVAGGKWDVLLQSLEGDYTPAELSAWVANIRAGCSDLISPTVAQQMLAPILFEYAARIDADATGIQGFGSGYRSASELFRALYDWFVLKGHTVESRAITYDATATTGNGGGSIIGNGAMARLTLDENTHDIEACTVETKRFKCVADQNSGVNENAEVFEVLGEAASPDSVSRSSFGSGASTNTTVVSKHAGQGSGGTLLTNGSFSTFDNTAAPKFAGWTLTAGAEASVGQDVAYYRTHPGATVDASLSITWAATTITLKQTLASMRVSRLDPDTPYVFRVMWARDLGAGANGTGGTLTIRCGSNSKAVTVAAQTGWQELILDMNQELWPRQFNQDPFDVEIEWSGATSGELIIDDAIFAPMDLVDGTYWFLRGNAATHTPWLLDDSLVFTDTGGAPATGKVQWWLYVAGLGYLPSSGSPSFADP